MPKRVRRIPEIFTEQEINQIIKQIIKSNEYPKNEWGKFFKHRDLCLIATIYMLGLRPGEACKLKFHDFNFKNMSVRIKGESNKTKKDRIIPVPKLLVNFYNLYFSFPRARFWKGSKYLFPSFKNPHISAERLKHIFREKVLKPLDLWEMPEIGKVPKIRLYTLRHSRASHILDKHISEKGNPDILAIANFLGHEDIRSTKVYLHTGKNYLEYLRNQIEI